MDLPKKKIQTLILQRRILSEIFPFLAAIQFEAGFLFMIPTLVSTAFRHEIRHRRSLQIRIVGQRTRLIAHEAILSHTRSRRQICGSCSLDFPFSSIAIRP